MGYGDDDGRGGGGGGSRRLSTTPTSAGRRGGGGDEGDGGGARELLVSERPRSSPSVRGGGGGSSSSPCFFATPESSARNAADKENRGEAQPRRAPAWDGVGSGGGSGCGVEDGNAAGGGCKAGGCGSMRGVSSSIKNNVGRATVASAAAKQPLESSKIRRVSRSPATRAAHESGGARNTGATRATSRGR